MKLIALDCQHICDWGDFKIFALEGRQSALTSMKFCMGQLTQFCTAPMTMKYSLWVVPYLRITNLPWQMAAILKMNVTMFSQLWTKPLG